MEGAWAMSMKLDGLFRGVVASTVNSDKQPHAVRVVVPRVTDNLGVWALPCWPLPVSTRQEAVPTVGEGVWVMFEGGDVNYPVYVGFFGGTPSVTNGDVPEHDHTYPVTSVNSKRGDVLLGASDVGAAAASHTHMSLDNLVINDVGSAANNFRVESDTEENLIFVDASDDSLWLGGTTNGLKISKGGKLRAYGTATWWDDLRVEPTVRGSGTKVPSYTAIVGGIYAYAFDNAVLASEKEVNFKMQMPHGWVQDTPIKLHLHWLPTTTGAAGEKVRWGFEYTVAAINSTFAAPTTIYATDPANPPSTTPTAMTHYLTPFAEVTTSGTGLSTMVLGRIFRNSSDAADTYGGTAYLLGIDAHIQMAQFGSNDEFAD